MFHFIAYLPYSMHQSLNKVATHNKVLAEKLLSESSQLKRDKHQACDTFQQEHRESMMKLKTEYAATIFKITCSSRRQRS